MREAAGEPGPTVYFCEQIRKLYPWQEIIGAFRPFFGSFRHGPGQSGEMKTAVFQTGLRQFAFFGEGGNS